MSHYHQALFLLLSFLMTCFGSFDRQATRRIELKQGALYGMIVEPRMNHKLQKIEQYLGIPYAEPPVGNLRFMPPGSPPFWKGVRDAVTAGPVCPQRFPDTTKMDQQRKDYFRKLRMFLENQSEDCLYLNIFAPYQGNSVSKLFPVMVFIHGESYEWNSGNPYDGSVLASYGEVVVVTFNFRLGVLGFLHVEKETSNFGLVDQIAALLWIQENIDKFGGDPKKVTLLGHGTGAACANLLMLSPLVIQDEEPLFQRVILMGGSALSDWALADNHRHVSYQVSQALNCPLGERFFDCLRKKRVEDLVNVSVEIDPYTTAFGPFIDGVVVPNDPRKSMTTYSDLFSRYQAIFGVTESEAAHVLNAVYLVQGMLNREFEDELRKYMRLRCEKDSESCVTHTLAVYMRNVGSDLYDGQPDRAFLNRNALLDILSDARTVAPLLQTALYHSELNMDSYFYVFGHKTASLQHLEDKSFHGEELPYVLGIPLDGAKGHYTEYFTEEEKLLSLRIMEYWSSFAYLGTPNSDRFMMGHMSFKERTYFSTEWNKFNDYSRQYLYLEYPPSLSSYYHKDKMAYWNEQFPALIKVPPLFLTEIRRFRTTSPRPSNIAYGTFSNQFIEGPFERKPEEIYGKVIYEPKNQSNQNFELQPPLSVSPDIRHGSTMNIFIIIGSIFLFINMLLFIGLYYRCTRLKKRNQEEKPQEDRSQASEHPSDKCANITENAFVMDGCNFFKSMSAFSKDDTYEAVRINGSTDSKLKLTRQMSSSTIDPQLKVREWIAHEIVHKYSPHFLRRPTESTEKTVNDAKFFKRKRSLKPPLLRSDSKTVDTSPSLGRSPTRPATPDAFGAEKPLLKKKPEKVSVAVDATPAGRGSSVMRQQPIELTKSLDCPSSHREVDLPLRRSLTMDNVSTTPKISTESENVNKSSVNIAMRDFSCEEPVLVKIHHGHSKSDPVEDFLSYTKHRKLRTFEPGGDVNVTSRDEQPAPLPLTPEESLNIIKRRNFPKVLPDLPAREAMQRKRMSMPVNHAFKADKNYSRLLPPAPPVRTTSTLDRKDRNAAYPLPSVVCHSAPVLAEEPPVLQEPEVTCNNLYVGPLIPKTDNAAIYEKLSERARPKLVVTPDPDNPVKRVKPKVIIRPSNNRSEYARTKNVHRVVASDNDPVKSELEVTKKEDGGKKQPKASLIPMLVKNQNPGGSNSSSESSSPSEESDTGTVVKRV